MSDQSGDDLENKLSSSSEGDVQRGLQFNHKSKVCIVYIYKLGLMMSNFFEERIGLRF